MLMFKNSERMVPMGVRMLFARNDQYYSYNTIDRVDHFIPQLEGVKRYTGLSHFMV